MRIFLSYQTRDLGVAERLVEQMRRERPDLDIFLAPRVLAAGAYWLPRLADEVAKADAVVLLAGERVGPWQELEYYEAQRLSRQPGRAGRPLIVPVVMTEQAPGLPFFDLLHRVFAPDPTHRDTVAAVLAALAGSATPTAAPAWKQFNPYKGLPALTSADAAFFFGRDETTAEILEALRPNPDRIVMLIGASGVGKSSVAQAGVLSALKSQLWPGDARDWPAGLADSRSWLQVTVRPGEAPLKELAFAFVRLIIDMSSEQDRDAEGWVRRFNDGARLGDLLRAVRQELNARTNSESLRHFVLYVDQGEELYSRAAPADARRFSTLLAEAARLPDFHVLGSLRADYYGQFQGDAALFSASRRIDVPPLRADQLETIIRRPAERLGAMFDSAEMPARIANATASESGALPLLSYLMSDMWLAMQSRDDGVLRWFDRPELIDIAAPLRERAERFRLRHPDREGALRRLFTLRLTHVPREGEAVRRRAPRAECRPEEWTIAETLAGPEWRLLTLNAPEAGLEPTAEVAHEQLLRKWPTLTRWLEEQREFLVWKGEIEAERREWQQLPESDRAAGLLSGRRLLRARQFLASHGEDVAAADRLFIGASEAAEIEAQNKALLDEQRLREAKYEAAIARAVSAKKIARRTVIASVGVSLTGAAAAFSRIQALRSEEERDRALAEYREQLADSRRFWTDPAEATVAGGAEEVVELTDASTAIDARAATATWGVAAVAADRCRYTGKGCVVALIGSGIDAGHPAFRGLKLVQKDFTGTGNGDASGHSTHTAGTIFGRPVNGQRFGVAPGVTTVLVAKVFDESNSGTDDAILSALRWASNHATGVDVICAPMGVDYISIMSASIGPTASEEEKIAAVGKGLREYLRQLRTYQSFSVVAASLGKGAVVITSVGNNSLDGRRVPVTSPLAVAQGVIAVGAVGQSREGYRVAGYSNSFPTYCAPGASIVSSIKGGGLEPRHGTSMACAHAAGVAALWWEHLRTTKGDDDVTSRMVADAMLQGVRRDGFAAETTDQERGAGLVQAPLTP